MRENSKSERQLAIEILIEINQQGAYNNIALRRALKEHNDWPPYKRAFVTELVNGTLRNIILIDHIIDKFSKFPEKPSAKMKPFIKEMLRTAIYQIRWMDKVPPSAAVNEAVKLARGRGFSALSGFVNGLLRNIVRAHESGAIDLPDDLGLRYSFPPWLAKELPRWLGEDAEDFCADSHIPPTVNICANVLKTTELPNLEGDITESEAYKKGHFFVMDEGAYKAAQATGAKPGQHIIDLCAAPGGKSFAMAGMMENRGQIISCDIHPHKIKLMKSAASRLDATCIKTEERDALILNPDWDNWADALLLDAPCTGFGVIRKRPDIKYTKTMEDVYTLAKLQRDMLSTAANYVKSGGILVYCTCTITTEENEDNVRWFLKNFPFTLDSETKHEGFYIARLYKK